MSSKTEDRLAIVAVAIFAVAALLRLIGLGSGLWYDEIVTLVQSARLPFRQILTEFGGVNTHPLYSLLAHGSLSVFGESAWALRLPAFAFGVASVVMTFILGARISGRVEGLAGAAIIATSYHHIWFSQNARGYTMMGFFALVATYFLLRAWESASPRDYIYYSLACAAGVYTHLTMAFVVGGHVVVIAGMWLARTRHTTTQQLAPFVYALAGAVVLTSIAYAPFVPSLVAHMGAEAPREAAKVATGGWAIAEAVRSVLSGSGIVGALAGGTIALVGGISLLRRAPFAVALLLVPAVVTAGTILVLGQPLRPRFFFFLAGAAAIFVGRGIGVVAEAVARRRFSTAGQMHAAVAVCTLLLVAASAAALPRNYQMPKQDFDGAVRLLDGEERRGARIAAAGPACLPLSSYYKREWACLMTAVALDALEAGRGRALVVFTLEDYIEDAGLRDRLRNGCSELARFRGTLGGGDLVICDPARREAR